MAGPHLWLTEAQFARLQPLLPNKPWGVPRVDDRRVISGILHVLRNGLMWRDAPACYGPSRRGLAGGPAFLCRALWLALSLLVPTVAHADICSRTTQVQTAIIALVPGKTACADITNTDLAGITGLTVANDSTLTTLTSGDFAGLTGLTVLYLNNNKLSSLPTGVFDALTSLTYLGLYINKLSSLPAGVFDNLSNLTTLHLGVNNLSSLPAGVFNNLGKLDILHLNQNSLSSLPAGVFDNLDALTFLDLYSNSLSSLPADVFDGLDSLETLLLPSNKLSSLPTGVFDALTSLTYLGLYINKLSSLPAGVFDNLSNLTTLHLGVNNLSSLPAGVFNNLGKLDILHLNQNSLSSLPAGVFDNLDALTFLDLYSNSLSSLPADVFDGLDSLETLLLPSNKLSSLPAGVFNSLANLKLLRLGNNRLSSLPAGVFNSLTLLETLYLHNNSLSGTIPALSTTLQRLHLAGNPITGWPSNLGSLTNLSILSLCETNLNATATLPAGLETRRTAGTLTVWSCLDIEDATATEGTALSFSVEHSTWPVRGAATAAALTVGYTTADGTATSTDYTGTTTGSLTIPANTDTTTWTKSANISVATTDDTVIEPDETFTVTLANVSNVIEVRRTATGTITDDDGAIVSIADASVTEGIGKGGLATFTVSLNKAFSQQVRVNYATADRTATAPGDYTATSGTLTFAAGETSKTISVRVSDDTIDEREETFSVTLSSPRNALLSPTATTATGTITDNDAAPTLSLADARVTEGDSGESIVTFTLSLSHLSSKAGAVDVKTSNGTATAGSDYVAQDDTLIGIGERTTVTIRVKVKGDTAEEADETFTLTLSNPTNATLSATAATATGTIRNDDTTLSIAAASVVEGNSGTTTASFPVRLSRASAKTVTVNYATADGTATAPGDYTAIPSTRLTFNPGTTSATIPVEVQGDTVVEPDETFTLTLSSPTNARLGNATATGTITNDDDAPLVPPGDNTGGDGIGGSGGGAAGDRHGNTPATATAITTGSNTPGQINAPTDVDYFTLSVPQSGLLVVETTGSTDTQGRLTTPDGQVLAQADSGGTRQNFQVTRRVAAGPYLIAVTGTGTGSYRLAVDLLVGFVDNPQPASAQSGIGVLSGWVCEAETVEIELNGVPQQAAYGTERADTVGHCEDTDNGFGLLWNWNLLGDGPHTVRVVVDGIVFATLPVTVTTLGLDTDFPKGLTGETTLTDFPSEGETMRLVWQEAQQNFVLAEGPVTRQGSTRDLDWAFLENPRPGSYQSGISVLSGWVCEAEEVVLEIDGTHRLVAAYGTERTDTEDKCEDTDNGFGLLWNWNSFGPGPHTVRLLVDGEEWATAAFTVTTLGAEMRWGLAHTAEVADFPSSGQAVTVEWQEAQQNFVITGVE